VEEVWPRANFWTMPLEELIKRQKEIFDGSATLSSAQRNCPKVQRTLNRMRELHVEEVVLLACVGYDKRHWLTNATASPKERKARSRSIPENRSAEVSRKKEVRLDVSVRSAMNEQQKTKRKDSDVRSAMNEQQKAKRQDPEVRSAMNEQQKTKRLNPDVRFAMNEHQKTKRPFIQTLCSLIPSPMHVHTALPCASDGHKTSIAFRYKSGLQLFQKTPTLD
jgi:hypothetical protein